MCRRSLSKPLVMLPIAPLLVAVLLSAGCTASGGSAPIEDRYSPAERTPKQYVVVRGDTLFSIAWRYGLDVKGLAYANGINQPFTIYPGQVLKLAERNPVAAYQKSAPAPTPVRPSAPVKSSPPVRLPEPRANTRPVPTKPVPVVGTAPSSTSWQWPVRGPVVRSYVATGQAHKGIDIGGKIGEPVRAARSGVVVYAGNGLVGYGNLIILKHSEQELSAYGHNRQLLATEGQRIAEGEVIAELGDSGTDSAKLHFEIRVNGKPVDPLRLLPRLK